MNPIINRYDIEFNADLEFDLRMPADSVILHVTNHGDNGVLFASGTPEAAAEVFRFRLVQAGSVAPHGRPVGAFTILGRITYLVYFVEDK